MKKIIVFGGGTGLSCILSGLKMFPIDVTKDGVFSFFLFDEKLVENVYENSIF